jgi:glycerophosphoryl diester phosphodiesterase
MQLCRFPSNEVLIAAHRGASKLAPENTMAAFQRAYQDGADLIELDVRASSDGELVVLHGADVHETTDGVGLVSNLTAREITTLSANAGFQGHYAIPRFADVLAWARDRIALMIDLKDLSPEAIDYAASLVENSGMNDSVVMLSFDSATLAYVKSRQSRLLTSLLVDRLIHKLPEFLASRAADMIQTSHLLWTSSSASAARDLGIAVCVWDVDPPGAIERARELHADVVLTRDPRYTRKLWRQEH